MNDPGCPTQLSVTLKYSAIQKGHATSTPSKMKSHSWHPVPTLLVSDLCRTDEVTHFDERNCLRGGLGQFPAKHLMLLAMDHAGRLGKYGA